MTMRVLTVSSLYPNSVQPSHGIFVENRMRRVHDTGRAHITVVAPVPWFPSRSPAFGDYAKFADVPREETRHGIRVRHPRYATIPKIGMRAQPRLYHAALKRCVARLIASEGPFDLIDAHYFYPDGVAAARLAADLGIPYVVTARGTDVNLIPKVSKFAREAVLETADRSAASITVCEALRAELIGLGAAGSKIHTLRNGVDLDAFSPPATSRQAMKQALGVPASAPLVVSVGGLIERKGHHFTIEAVAALPGVHLLIAGGGPGRGALESLIAQLGVRDRIRLTGPLAHSDLRGFYGAADISVLASSREGWANVLLESMACGTPVVATSVWGTPEVVAAPEAGLLAEHRTADCLQQGIAALLSALPDRDATRRYAEGFAWDDTVNGVLNVFESALRQKSRISGAVS